MSTPAAAPVNTVNIPKITAAQLIAAVTWVVTQAVAFGWLDSGTAQLVVSITGAVLPMILMIADAILRHGRAPIAAAAITNGAVVKHTLVS